MINVNSRHEAVPTYPAEWNELMDWLTVQKVEGVVFLSGDRHHTEVLKMERSGLYPLYEFTSSPLTSGVHTNLRDETNNPLRVEGTLVNTIRNFGLISVTGERGKRKLTMKTIDRTGKEWWEVTLSQEELRVPRD